MSNYLRNLVLDTNSITSESQIIIHNRTRFSILTNMLLRVETSDKCYFCDAPTQAIINRNFSLPSYTVDTIEDIVIIKTDAVRFVYNTKTDIMESITLSDGRKVSDYKKGNLKGTKRTLDGVNGATSLGDGILSTEGVAVLDDSSSLILCDNGKVLPRIEKSTDMYYFAYGFEYKNAIKDFFLLTGNPPLIPRFALGNWWSRYKAYTQKEYTDLMQRFINEKIPITVATVDMDWHWVDVVKRFGTAALDDNQKSSVFELFYNLVFPGWTGYSWNTELFPDPKGFLSWLKDNGFKVTMNLHPASGCKYYENAYEEFCSFMDIDKNSKKQIRFDITDEKFIEGYFRFLHHPHESDGVDFWWIDWQQGKNTSIQGLDPLWALNHYHSLDSARNGMRPLILSRFAGAGSHRYPLGFSGDTVQTWDSLDFQPYFTATASNIGYSWWSHDIGGHCRGYRDDELYLRWLQFGVFSPIMRLHSTSNEFMGKEPWMYNKFVEKTAVDFLKLRHRLIPYIYSMNKKTAEEGRCLIEPMYYEDPKDPRAYECPNEYYFGTELIICPITKPCDKRTGVADTKIFLPKGRYTDILSDKIYRGNALFSVFRDQSCIPVLAKEGAIIPMYESADSNDVKNPESLEILISRGNNTFVLYEDDGETLKYKNGAYCETEFNVRNDYKDLIFTINKSCGDKNVIPSSRNFLLSFIDVKDTDQIKVCINGAENNNYSVIRNNILQIRLTGISAEDTVTIKLNNIKIRQNRTEKDLKIEMIAKIRGSNDKKAARFTSFLNSSSFCPLPGYLRKQIEEIDNLYY